MNIKILCDDTRFRDEFECEHGLSILVTTNKHCVLFDVGQSDVFYKNALKLGVDLSKVDVVVLSHGHYDHCNGLERFFELNSSSDIYIHENAFEEFMHGENHIGISNSLKNAKNRFRLLSQTIELDDELSIYPASLLPQSQSCGLMIRKNGELVEDSFEHEIYLVCREGNNSAMLTGCAHRGIENIARFANSIGVSHLIGGFHMTSDLSRDEIRSRTHALSSLPIQYYTGHCTSETSFETMQTICSNIFHKLGAGNQFAIGNHGEIACALFRQGYNCSQSVFGAFANELNLDTDFAMRIACSFGGGMGRLREVCGAVSGMLLVCGMMNGYVTPETGDVKAKHYQAVQKLCHEFRNEAGSLICRNLLGGRISDLPTPTERTPEFYTKRPCERLIYLAATIVEKTFF